MIIIRSIEFVCYQLIIHFVCTFIEGSVTPQNVRKWAVEIVTHLRSLAQIRDELKQFKLANNICTYSRSSMPVGKAIRNYD